MGIHFGTDGWRAIIGDEFTFANVRRVAQAVADWIGDSDGNSARAMIIGYDTRFLSDRFAAEFAQVLAGNGITVYLPDSPTPTPVISFAVKQLGAAGGVMVTASHNPAAYNGIKLKDATGGSASKADCARVEEYLERNRPVRSIDMAVAEQRGLVQRYDPMPAYEAHLETLVSREVLASHPSSVVVDPMHGAGRDHIRRWLEPAGWTVAQIRGEPNPSFGGVSPEPILANLHPLRSAVLERGYALGLATDGDADRTGAIDGTGRFVDPHCIFSLVLRYLVEKRGWRGTVVKSVSVTRMVDRLCARYQLPVVETPVGFGHISDLMLVDDFLMGGEESGGISIQGHVPVGDGILLGLLLAEIAADARATLAELVDDLQRSVGPAHYARHDLRIARPINKRSMSERLAGDAPKSIGGVVVDLVQQNDGVKYLLVNGGWLLIRPSGTEPVLRVYAEAPEPAALAALLAYGQSIAAQV